MSGRKDVLTSYQIITSGSMAGNLTSTVTNIQYLDNIAIQLNFTGTPTGTFAVQGSIDNSNWITLSLSPSPIAGGAASQILLDLNQLSFPYIRVTYTATSGTGTLNAFISGKQV